MPIAVICSQCQKNFRVADNFAGKQGRCPQCNFVLIVPNPDTRGAKPFGDSTEPPVPPPSSRDRFDEPPRRRPERNVRDDDDLPPRPPRRPDREQDRYREDDYDAPPPRDRGQLSWRIVGLGRHLLIYESILSLVGRGCFLLIAILSLTLLSDPYSRRAGPSSIYYVLVLIGFTTILASSIFGLVGKLSTRFAPDSLARSEGGVSSLLAIIALGVLLVSELYAGLVIFDRGEYGSRGPGQGALILLFAIMLIGMCLYYISDLFLGRFIGRVGKLARNNALASWGSILTIYLLCLVGLAVVSFIVVITAPSGDLVMIFSIIYLAADYGGALLCLLPRPRLTRAIRQLDASGPVASDEDRFDEDDMRPRGRDRRRYRDEEYDE